MTDCRGCSAKVVAAVKPVWGPDEDEFVTAKTDGNVTCSGMEQQHAKSDQEVG